MAEIYLSFINDSDRPYYIRVWDSGWKSIITHAGVLNGYRFYFYLMRGFYNFEFVRPALPLDAGVWERGYEKFTPFFNIPVLVGAWTV